MDRLKSALKMFGDRWDLLSFNQRIMVGTLVLAMILSTVFLFYRAQDDYDVLYSNLSLPDAAAIVAKLKESRTPFKLSAGGTTILVPTAQKNQLVLDTAGELTSEQTINLSQIPPVVSGDIKQEMIKQRNTDAIENILKSIQGIKNAQVIISKPEESLFTDNEEPTTASVMLMVEPGFRLREEQVKTVKNLVAHAVPGLQPENVVLADNSGNPLSGPSSLAVGGMSEAETRRHNFENETRKKILEILAPVVGKENVVVAVSAILNFDQAQTRIHRVIPAGGTTELPTGIAVSSQEQTEEYTGAQSKAGEGGKPGVDTNAAPTYQGTDGKDAKSDYKSVKKTTNYTNSEEDKNVVYAPGAIERLTVAVVLNKVITAQETEEIRELVESAAGVDLARGDAVDIKGFQFSNPPKNDEEQLAEATKSAQEQAFWIHISSVASVVVLGLAGLIVFYLLVKRPAEGELVEEMDQFNYMSQPEQMLESTEVAMIEANLDPEVEHMREAIGNMVSTEPEEAARVLMTYMKEM